MRLIFLLLLMASFANANSNLLVSKFIDAIKGDSKEVAKYVNYPLHYIPDYLPIIKDEQQFTEMFNDLFDDTLLNSMKNSDIEKDWSFMGKGYMYKRGQVWLDQDGTLLSVNKEHINAKELTKKYSTYFDKPIKDIGYGIKNNKFTTYNGDIKASCISKFIGELSGEPEPPKYIRIGEMGDCYKEDNKHIVEEVSDFEANHYSYPEYESYKRYKIVDNTSNNRYEVIACKETVSGSMREVCRDITIEFKNIDNVLTIYRK